MPVIDLEADMGIAYDSEGSLLVLPEVQDPPAGVILAEVQKMTFVMPDISTQTLDAYGHPDPAVYVPTLDGPQPWGAVQILFGGVDVTFHQNIPTLIGNWASAEPFADTVATITFPQISPFNPLPFWLDEYVNVDLVAYGGIIVWEGLAAAVEWTDEGLVVECIGVLYQADLYVRAPGSLNTVTPIGTLLHDYAFNKTYRPGYRFATLGFDSPQPSRQSRYRGSWESPLAYAQRLLEDATDEDNSFSIRIQRPRIPVLTPRDLTTEHYTVAWGQPGIEISGARNDFKRANVIYGTGENTAGSEWRGIFRDPTNGSPRIQPLSYEPAVHGFDEVGDGTLTVDTARRDSTLIRIEEYHSFGQGVDRAGAKGAAEIYRLRIAEPNYTARMVLESDPIQRSRFEMKAGENIRVKNFLGEDEGVLFHISACNVNWANGTVDLTLDSLGRNATTVEAIAGHTPDAYDPFLDVQDGRKTGQINDSVNPWDTDAGSGWMPSDITNGFVFFDPAARAIVQGETWTYIAFLASEKDTILQTEFYVDPPARFHVSYFNQLPNPEELPDLPLATGEWDERPRPTGHQVGYGYVGALGSQAAGYAPGYESMGSPVTGALIEYGPWQYDHADVDPAIAQPMFLWVAVWIEGDAEDEFECFSHLTRGVGH